MSRAELFFNGTDFTPLVKLNRGIKTYNFDFKCEIDGKEATFDGSEKKGLKKSLSEIYQNKDLQLNLLKSFLEKSQENINKLLLDKNLTDDEKQLYTYHKQQMFFGGLVGVVSIKEFPLNGNDVVDITLQINTRLDKSSFNNENNKPYFLMTLLFNGFVPLSNSQVNRDSEGLTDMLLLYSFIEKYRDAYVKGYFKTYHSFEENDSKVKGSINVPKHIKLNAGMDNGKIAYSHKEKTESNYINHLIIAAYEQLKRKYYQQTISSFKTCDYLRQSIENLKYLINYPQYSKKVLVSKNMNPLSHPYYTEYEDMRKICLKILREEKVSVFSGSEADKVEGILMYVPKLWEKYIENYLRNIKYKAQDKIRILDVNSSGEYRQLTQPDFVFYNGEHPFMILDAKFKPGWMNVATTGEIGELLFEDYNKCLRDMVSINSHASGVIFPTNDNIANRDSNFERADESFEYKHNISKFNSIDKFYTFPVFIPKIEGDFTLWKQKFSENCSKTFEIIKNIVNQNSAN